MDKSKINHNALTHLVEADAVSLVLVKAIGDTWAVSVQVGNNLKIVMAKNSGKPRVWRKLDTVAKYLKELGVDKFDTDVSNYDPSKKSLRRPDSANTLKQTHKSHQTLQQRLPDVTERKSASEPLLKVNIQPDQASPQFEPTDVTDPIKQNTTDKAIELAKHRWEERRAKILQEENPRAK